MSLKNKLIRLLYIWVALGCLSFVGSFIENEFKIEEIAFYLTLPVQAYGIYMFWHIYSYCCPNTACQRNQIIRSIVPPIYSWPEENCYHCGAPLNTKYQNGRPIE